MKAARPADLIKAPWIRPEDLSRYEDVGIQHFKIAGREQETPWILRAVAAYSARSYQGDLNDLVPGFDALDPFGQFPLRVKNALLEGFIEFFDKKDCRLGCGGCTYCDEWAQRAISAEGDRERYVKGIERFLRRFASGAFRASLTHP
jgi:collagenase-like PrtC family protease